MKVSALIPVYNKAAFVREAVDSLLHGTFRDLEVICVDDKSTDDSLAMLRTISDARLRIIELEENRGPAGAANAGLDACTGEYIVRLDADDIAVPDRVAMQVAFMDAHPEVGASGGQVQLFGEREEPWTFPLGADACAAQVLFGVPLSQGASIMRRSVLNEHALRYDPQWPRVGEDWLFWVRMSMVTRFANLDRTVINYRRGPQNISSGRNRAADFTHLQQEVFTAFDIPFTPQELDLHLMGSFIFNVKPTKERVIALRTWYDKLLRMNEERSLFPKEAFKVRVERQWSSLFHYLPAYGSGPALQHLRSSGKWPKDRLTYLAKYRINAFLGRAPKR